MNRMARWVLALSLCVGCATAPSEQDLQRAQTHRQLAEVKYAKGEFNYAVREYIEALKLNERDPEAHFGLGDAYRELGSYEQAQEHFLRALEINPDHQDSRLNLSALYLQTERWDDAIREATTLIEDLTFLNPARAYVNRAWAHYKLGDLDAAQADLTEAIQRNSGNWTAHLNLGIVLSEKGQLAESMAQLNQVVELLEARDHPRFACAEAEARFRLAKAYVALADRSNAMKQLEEAQKAGSPCVWQAQAEEYLALLR